MKKLVSVLLLLVVISVPQLSFATPVTINATVTADNHYGLYHGKGNSLTYVGRNEFGTAGAPGLYNWSLPESYTFTADTNEYLYIVGWSDDAVAQGVLGQFLLSNGKTLLTNPNDWEVALTQNNLGDGDALPNFTTLDNLAYQQVQYSLYNGVAPWGTIPGIQTSAQWIWGGPMAPGSGYGEFQVFRTKLAAVPEPTTVALLGSGLLVGYRRRKASKV